MNMIELTRVAEIEFETETWSNTELGNQFEGLSLQPKGIRVDNGDCRTYWMSMYDAYTLVHDGVGWRVTSSQSQDNNAHIRRLADASRARGSFVTSLPVHGGGTVELTQGVTYQLAFNAAEDNTRTALFLSRSGS